MWALETTISAMPKDEDQRLLVDLRTREKRFELLEQGLDDETKNHNHELSLCLLERGHGNGPPAGARNEIYCRDATAAELRLTIQGPSYPFRSRSHSSSEAGTTRA